MRVIAVVTPQTKPDVRTIPLPPSAMRFCCHARVAEEPSAPRRLFIYRSDSRAKLDSESPHQATTESRFCCSASFVARGEAGNCSTVACCPSSSWVSSTTCPSGNSNAS